MRRLKSKRLLKILLGIALAGALILGGLFLYGKYQISKIPGLSAADVIEYTTANNPDARITVGISKDSKSSFTVYGENAEKLPPTQHVYEIGSITKTVTAALINRAAEQGRLNLDDTIDKYLRLPAENQYPTIRRLLTHTSGYASYYFETPMIANFFTGRNSYCGVTREMTLAKLQSLNIENRDYPFEYSNFGYAALGLVLESVYETDYTALVNDFLKNDLRLPNTHVSDGGGDLSNYWQWQPHDAYLPAGGLTSTIDDMLAYARAQLDPASPLAPTHAEITAIESTNADYKTMGINMDAIGMAWIIDKENGFTWHNGGTGNYNSYLAFDPASQTAVVVLSNLPPNFRIPATVLGVKLMEELR